VRSLRALRRCARARSPSPPPCARSYLFVLHDAPAVVKVGGYELGRREKLLTLIPGTIIMVAVTGACTLVTSRIPRRPRRRASARLARRHALAGGQRFISSARRHVCARRVGAGALSSLVWVLFISSLVALPHAVTHEKPELDALDQLELEGAHLGEPRPMHSGLG